MFILRNYQILTGGTAVVTNVGSNKQSSNTDIR